MDEIKGALPEKVLAVIAQHALVGRAHVTIDRGQRKGGHGDEITCLLADEAVLAAQLTGKILAPCFFRLRVLGSIFGLALRQGVYGEGRS